MAAYNLQHFLDHKNGSTRDVLTYDVNLTNHVRNDPFFSDILRKYFDGIAAQATPGAHNMDNLSDESKPAPHLRWWPGEGENFYAFAGFDLRYRGTLTLSRDFLGNTAWTFTGTIAVYDVYDFPDKLGRRLFGAYEAGWQLQLGPGNYNYTTFQEKMIINSFTISGITMHEFSYFTP